MNMNQIDFSMFEINLEFNILDTLYIINFTGLLVQTICQQREKKLHLEYN